MKEILVFTMVIVLLMGCTATKKEVVIENNKERVTENEKKIVMAEVEKFEAEPLYGALKLKWDISNEKAENIAGFDILYSGETLPLKKIKAKKEDRELLIENLEPLDTINVKIKTVSEKNDRSLGVGIKNIKIKHKNVIEDEYEGKKMFIYLPVGYNESDEKYPVMYMTDGQNLFSKAYAVNEWGIDETLDRLTKEGKIEKTIVVGLFHAGEKRTEEYTAYFYDLGKEFAEKLTKKIIPYIENKYKVKTGKENRGIMGSSRGGLTAVYMINNYDEYFGFAAGVSPSDAWKWKEYNTFPKKDVKIWIDNGTADYILGYARSEATRAMVDGYTGQGHEYGKSLIFYEVKDASHNEIEWEKRAAYPFIMFKGKENGKIIDFNIFVEVFHNNEGNPVFAVNPVADFENGIRYSLYTKAEYSINGKATIDNKGIFKMNGESEVEITVKYEGIEKKALVNAGELEKMRVENAKAR